MEERLKRPNTVAIRRQDRDIQEAGEGAMEAGNRSCWSAWVAGGGQALRGISGEARPSTIFFARCEARFVASSMRVIGEKKGTMAV